MRYLSVTEIAKKWNISERSVRNYCARGRVPGAFLTGKTWNLPENAKKPERSNKRKEQPVTLLDILRKEKAIRYSGGIYHKTQIDLTYNSNHMEGSRLTHDQTRYIFETNTIGVETGVLNVDDVIETVNHFRCIDRIIDNAKAALTEYSAKEEKTFEDILDFHVKFERIHPFQDAHVIIGIRLEKPSKINGFALLSPIFLSHAGWREDGTVHINTYYTESQMGLCA